MTETLRIHGFAAAGHCQCDGVHTMKYRRGKYLIKVRSRRYKFCVYEGGTTVRQWTDLSQLQTVLNELFPITETVVSPKTKVPAV
jgi:hypothetical protein